MCQLSTMTRTQLETYSKEQLIQMALEGVTTEAVDLQELNEDGEMVTLSTTIKDAYTGAVVETKTVERTFHPNKAVDKIKVTRLDGEGKKIDKYHIKHSEDGIEPPYLVYENGEEEMMAEAVVPVKKVIMSELKNSLSSIWKWLT